MKRILLLVVITTLGTSLALFLFGWGLNNWVQKNAEETEKPTLANHNKNLDKLVIAVAPFATSQLSAGEGVKVQEKIAHHMEADLGLKVIRLSKPINMGPGQPDLKVAFPEAEKAVANAGADLLIWGNESDAMGSGWNTYITASVHDRCLAREQGFATDSTSDLDHVAEMDIVEVLDWVTASWRGLIDSSQGMFYPAPVQDMVLKTDTILGIAAGKNLDPSTMLTIKRSLAFLLGEYGYQMKDVSALQNSIRLAREIISVNPVDPETKMPLGDMEIESILGQSLFTLGNLQANTENLDEAAAIYQTALKGVTRKDDPADWADLQTDLGAALAMAGERQADPVKINQAVEAFSGAEQETDPVTQPHQWLFVQTGLGASYLFLGAREVGTDNLKKAVSHFIAAESKDAKVLFPDDYATAESNIGMVYYSLGQRERSAGDMKQSILHSTQAADQFRAMGNNYGLGFALSHLGQAQLRLAHYTEDDALMDQCQANLKQSELFIPEAQDANMWGENQLYLGIVLGSKGDKTSNIQMMQDASALFEGLKTLYDPKIRRPMWNEINNFQAADELTLGKLSCDTKNEEGVIAQLNKVKEGMGSQKDDLRAVQVDDILASAMAIKAGKDKDLKLMLKAYRLMKDVVSRAESGNDPVLLVSYRSDMAALYANLLSRNPEPRLIAEAGAFLDAFEKAGLTSPVPADEATHQWNAAKLERVLAEVNKNPARLAQARAYAANALKLFQTYHYSFREAACDMELGKMDMLLAKLTQDKSAGAQAVAEFRAAQKIYQTLGLCFESEAKAKIAEASAL